MNGASRKRLRMSSSTPPPQQMRMPPPPSDIIFSILLMLPIKSLLRCRLVCKNWDSIIRSRTFVLNYNFSRSHRYLFANFVKDSSGNSRSVECTIFDNNSLSLLWKVPSNFYNLPHILLVIGSCNGLLLVTSLTNFGRQFCLWNPSIRKHKFLTTSCLFNGKFVERFRERNVTVVTIVGLGFDSKTNDFKILRMVYFHSKDLSRNHRRRPEAEIYSLSSDSWRRVGIPNDVVKRLRRIISLNYAYIHGCISWMATFIDEQGMLYNTILEFEVSKERFREVMLPNDYKNEIVRKSHRLCVFKGLLALVISRYENHERVCIIWKKNESSWIRRRVRFAGFSDYRWCVGVGDYLIIWSNSNETFAIDLQGKRKKPLQNIPCPYSINTFTESLTLL